MMLLDKFYNKYIIKGVLLGESPIHIGSGDESYDPTEIDNSVIRDANGNPYIPGSSLKGVLRNYMETLFQSGIDDRYTACLIVNQPCLGGEEEDDKGKYGNKKAPKKKIDEIKESVKDIDAQEKDKLLAQRIYDELCTVCRIFGNHYFASKLVINDCLLKDEKAYVEWRDGVGIDRDTGTAADRRYYNFEQLAAGTRFEFRMTVDNLEPEHEEVLKLIIKVLESGDLRVGGKTSVGLGAVRLTEVEAYKIEPSTLKKYVMDGLADEMRWQYV